jgi:ABC-type Fe3+/spermidine/putrescine transport system ATPase subunit
VFVADFLGVSNLMDADATERGPGHCTVAVGDFHLRAACGDLSASGPVKIVARPERIQLLAHGAQDGNCLPGMIERTVYVGATLQVMVRLATGAQVQASITNTGESEEFPQGTPVAVHIPADALRILGRPAKPTPADPDDPEAETPDQQTATASA